MWVARLCLRLLICIVLISSANAQTASSTTSSKLHSHMESILIAYKSGVTEKDKERVRTKIGARLKTKFDDPGMEEVEVAVPANCPPAKAVSSRIKLIQKDPAVQTAQASATYSIK